MNKANGKKTHLRLNAVELQFSIVVIILIYPENHVNRTFENLFYGLVSLDDVHCQLKFEREKKNEKKNFQMLHIYRLFTPKHTTYFSSI